MRRLLPGAAVLVACLSGCQSSAEDLRALAELPPLDCSVLVTGGTFLAPDPARSGTFVDLEPDGRPPSAADGREAIPIRDVVEVLRRSTVFHSVEVDTSDEHRRVVRDRLRSGTSDAEVLQFLQQARERGFDYLLVVEELQDGPVGSQGTNTRWPVTFVTWILLGLGFLIPDHTFESRATLRVTLRDLQTGRVLHDPLLVGGPIELALFERSDFWGIMLSILVPPFLVGDDRQTVGASVREITERRLLLSLARDLKSESVRQRLLERSAARLLLQDGPEGLSVVADSAESLSVVRLRADGSVGAETAAAFERELLASRSWDGERFRYQARLPVELRGSRVQVLVGTIPGNIASATFAPRERR